MNLKDYKHDYHTCSFCRFDINLNAKLWKFARTMTREQYGQKVAERNRQRKGSLNNKRIGMRKSLLGLLH